MEELVAQIRQAVEEGAKGSDTSAKKMDTLWKLEKVINQTPKEEIQKLYPELSKLLYNSLLQEKSLPIVRVISSCISTLFKFDPTMKGPSTFMKELTGVINNRNTSNWVRISCLRCMGKICLDKGMQIAAHLTDTVNFIAKQVKSTEVQVRVSAVNTLRCVIEGSGSSSTFLHDETMKILRVCFSDKQHDVRIAASECLTALGKCSTSFSYLEGSSGGLNITAKNLDDSHSGVRTAAAQTIGHQLAIAIVTDPPPASTSSKKKTGKSPTNWTLDVGAAYLGSLFTKSGSKKELRVGISQAYVALLQTLKPKFVEGNIELILGNILGLLGYITPRTSLDEALHARFCVSYILRYGLGEHLGEMGQQSAIKYLSAAVPKLKEQEHTLVAVLYELCRLLLSLGEGAAHVKDMLSTDALPPLVTHSSLSVRLNAILCMRCLGIALPTHLAQLLGDSITRLTSAHSATLSSPKEQLRKNVTELQGLSQTVAALIAAISTSSLGVPTALSILAFQTATMMLQTHSANIAVSLVNAEAAWSILSGLMQLGSSFAEFRIRELFDLWSNSLGCDIIPHVEREVLIFAQMRAVALPALEAFVTHCSSLITESMAQEIGGILGNITDAVKNFNEAQFQPPTLKVLRRLKLNLFKVFLTLPPTASAPWHSQLIALLVNLLSNAEGVSLRSILEEEDDILGPWGQLKKSQQAVEEKLLKPLFPLTEESVSRVWTSDAETALDPSESPLGFDFTQAIRLFAALFVTQPENNKQQITDHFFSLLKTAPPSRRQSLHLTVVSLILHSLKETKQKKTSFGKISTTLEFIKGLLADNSIKFRRAGAEAVGMIARTEGDNVAKELVKFCFEMIKRGKDSHAQAPYIHALGCIKRSIGGMRSNLFVKEILSILPDIFRDSPTASHVTPLHSLYLTIEAAGLSFSTHAQSTVELVYSLMLNEDYPYPEQYQSLGRVVNAVVHSLGPELKTTSQSMQRCTVIVEELMFHDQPLVQLEAINFRQSQLLFAPQTINASSIGPALRPHLTSPYLVLRQATITCLRQLIHVDLSEISSDSFIHEFFMMLDSEGDSKLRNELQLLLATLLEMLAPSSPSKWIALCNQMVMTSARTKRGAAAPKLKRAEDVPANEEEDEGNSGMLQSVQVQEKDEDDDTFVPRWRTKLFSMECVRKIISLVGESSSHFDLSRARKEKEMDSEKDFLVFNLGDLVRMAFSVATSEVEALRPVGVMAVKDIVEKFASSQDPDYEGHSLLEQFQAQIKSSLTPAFDAQSLPFATAAASSALISFVTSDITRDEKAGGKVLSLLTSYVDKLDEMGYRAYNEKATTMVQLSVLSAVAQLRVISLEESGERFSAEIESHLTKLKEHWLNVLKDYAVLTTQDKEAQKNYNAAFFSSGTINDVIQYFKDCWKVVLEACCSLSDTEYWSPVKEDETPSERERMKAKETTDFHLLLGLISNSLTSTNTSTGEIVSSLRSLGYLLGARFLKEDLFSHDAFNETTNVLRNYLESGIPPVKLEVVRVILKLVSHLPADYFPEETGQTAINSLQEMVILCIASHVPNLFPEQEVIPVAHKDPNPEELLKISIASLGAFPKHYTSSMKPTYGPYLFRILLRICEISSEENSQSYLLSPATEALQALVQIDGEDWIAIVNSAFEDVLQLAEMQNKRAVFVPVIFNLIIAMTHEIPNDSLHSRTCDFFRACLRLDSIELQNKTLQGLRILVQTGFTKPDTPLQKVAYKYLSDLVADVVIVVRNVSMKQNLTPEEVAVSTEGVRLVVMLHSITPPEQHGKTLSIVVPILVGLLRPNSVNALHDSVFQILMKLASTSPEFKAQVALLTDEEKQKLEASVKHSVAQQEAAKKAQANPSKQGLKLDFSKYKK